jgi:hypothetical protein
MNIVTMRGIVVRSGIPPATSIFSQLAIAECTAECHSKPATMAFRVCDEPCIATVRGERVGGAAAGEIVVASDRAAPARQAHVRRR